ncbi:hypothetical protein B0H13DRAFT_2334545 [Mycena leptocephala]|nr:hypothetical protein B0H13DRAFT_2334545 [Mycena leptocephala]
MFNRSVSLSISLSFPPPLNATQNHKKRRRQPSEFDERPPAASTSDSKPKVSRRIDPDCRLGPELVNEMDAFIVPGAKMPSFQIRQQFVKKYNVDRRHIYDYFHSRGLRVAKEDKHLHISHRMRKPAASQPAASQIISPNDLNLVESAIVSDPSPAVDSAPSNTNPISPRTNLVESTDSSKRRITASFPQAPALQISIRPLLPSSQSTDLTASSSLGEDLALLSLEYPVSDDKLRESFGPDFTPFPPALPEDPLFELDELQRDIPQTSSKPVSVRDSLFPLEDLSGLSGNDRIEFYNLINAGIGPAQGIIEECAGTYKAHMERLYFNRSFPGAQLRSYSHHNNHCYPTVKMVVNAHRPAIVEKENMTTQLPASRTLIDARPSNNYYYRQTAVPATPQGRCNPHYLPLHPDANNHPPCDRTSSIRFTERKQPRQNHQLGREPFF